MLTVVFVEYPNYANGRTKGGEASGAALSLNSRFTDRELTSTIVHESMHNYDNLLNASEDTLDADGWPDEAHDQVRHVFGSGYIKHGFTTVWGDLHDTGVDVGVAGDYLGSDGWAALTPSAAIALGVATRYGARNLSEDIADMAAGVQHRAGGKGDALCAAFAAEAGSDEFPVKLSILFVKLQILKAIEAIDESAFDSCVGDVEIEKKSGIHFEDLAFDMDLKAGTYEDDGKDKFAILGQTPQYRVLIEVEMRDQEPPLGLHRLDDFSWFPTNGVWLDENDSSAGDRISGGGIVLITDVPTEDTDFTRGAVFFLSFSNAFGLTQSQFAYVPFYVEQ